MWDLGPMLTGRAQEEFVRGDTVCTEALSSGSRGPAAWSRLLEPFDFFRQFKNYLQVPLCSACVV